MRNRYGLSRNIPQTVKNTVRKRDGFGCVMCGKGIITYEHFDPPFKNAHRHDPKGITLLCFQCQGKSTKGLLSRTSILQAISNPKCKQQGYTNEFFDLEFPIIVHFGNIVIRTSDQDLLVVGGEKALSISRDSLGGPLQLSGVFRDELDRVCLAIDHNEWKASMHNWDIDQTGNRLKIVNNPLNMQIIIRAEPPHELIFESLDTYFNGNKFHIDSEGKLIINRKSGEELTVNIPTKQHIHSLNIS